MIDPQSPVAELLREHAEGFSCLGVVRDNRGSLQNVRCTWANPAAARLLGRTEDSLIDCDMLQVLAPTGELHARGADVLLTGEPWTGQGIMLNDRFVQPRITRFGDDLGLWLNDVTPMRALQDRIDDQQRRLEQIESESQELRALFHTVFESSPVGIAVLDRSHRYVAVNDALVDLLGRSSTELIGRTSRELWADVAPVMEAVLDEVLRTGQPRLGNELEVVTASGSRCLLFGSYPVRHGDQILGTGTFVVDITDRKQVEEYQRHLIGIVSHDLRSPLQAVLIGAQLLLRAGSLDEAQHANAQRILRCARRMNRLVEDLFDFTRLRVGQPLTVSRRASNIDEICRQVLSETESAFPGRRLHYHGAGDPRGHWDSGRLVQVLLNLVTNAFKYSPPDVSVELAWWREPQDDPNEIHDDLVIEVRNGGPPMAAELVDRLFEPFSRGDAADSLSKTSLGLGLYIVKHLVQAHDGSVSVSSSEENGTVFSVRIPSGPPAELPVSRWHQTVSTVVPFKGLS